VRRGFGGPVLPGKQWVSWIHLADVVGLVLLALGDERIRGPLNVVALGTVRQREFMRTLGQVVGKPARLPVPGWLLRMGLGISAEIIIHGRHVVPQQALARGYAFAFPALDPALRDRMPQPTESRKG
jgi:NAD dependent epimerase/dehydratase family enzyme